VMDRPFLFTEDFYRGLSGNFPTFSLFTLCRATAFFWDFGFSKFCANAHKP
jgi:hypothetical protein